MPKKRGGGGSAHSKIKTGPHGRFIRQKNKKRGGGRGRGGHRNGGHRGAMPELMDLEQNVYIPDASNSAKSMSSLSKRPGRLMDEVSYTKSHQSSTLGRELRNRPVEFCKAKEVYNPNTLLFSKKKSEDAQDDNSSGKEGGADSVETTPVETPLPEMEKSVSPEPNSSSERSDNEDDKSEEPEKTDSPKIETLDFVIDEEGDENNEEIIAISSAREVRSSAATQQKAEYESVLNIGKMSLNTYRDEMDDLYVDLTSFKKKQVGFEEPTGPIDYSDDSSLYNDYIENIRDAADSSEEEDESDEESKYGSVDKSGSKKEIEIEDNESSSDSDSQREPEYGFLPEDFEFDVSKVSISNIRYGIQNSYYVKCVELTSSDEHAWVDEKELFDYLLSNGVREHRLGSFVKYVAGHLIHEEDSPVEESEVYISESSEDNHSDVSSETEDDNLDDLVLFSKSQKHFNDDNRPDTRSRRVKGKGANKQLDLDDLELEADMYDALQDHYSIHRMAKKKKKDKRDLESELEAIKKHNLLVKYPYSLHVKEMISELELFLHDASRSDLNFPPLDPHGNKTVTKLATCFNLKTSRCGDGRKAYIRASKGRKTFHYLPRYNQIIAISRQRPIFNRTDQRRPKNEITETDGNAKKDSRRGRNRDSNAYVREGDIVGGKAPEIDPNNVGRKLLEKLGWVKGEGLGIHGNKGISEPVVAKVKTTKTGIK